MDRADSRIEVIGGSILEEVAVCPAAENLQDILLVVMRREHQDLDTGGFLLDPAGSLQPVELGHRDVHQHHVGFKLRGQFNGAASIGSLAHHIDTLAQGQQ